MSDKWCSFCGKGTGEVEYLIPGPTVFICPECVWLCVDIMAAKAPKTSAYESSRLGWHKESDK